MNQYYQKIYLRNINLARAIVEYNHYDMDKIPKLVVPHKKNIDTMEQLVPSWFNEHDYRCIHCFSYDVVFTP
ncbi:unnamed protein product [Rotaria sp. Silwood2]|nr:unnamed protein product [Rotaria sp. Silwood2]CAF4094260.1 unnamed protein product [Rotaria sp. Silwood2]